MHYGIYIGLLTAYIWGKLVYPHIFNEELTLWKVFLYLNSILSVVARWEIDIVQWLYKENKDIYIVKDGNLLGFFFSLIDGYRE